MGASSAAQLTAGNVCHVEYVINDTDAAGQASRHGAKGKESNAACEGEERAARHASTFSTAKGTKRRAGEWTRDVMPVALG